MAMILHFIVVFFFTLGVTNLLCTLLIIIFKDLKDDLLSWKQIIKNNILSAFLISLSITITIHFLPFLYKNTLMNNGVLNISNNYFNKIVVIESNNKKIKYKLCGKNNVINNSVEQFYVSLNNSLKECQISGEVKISIIKNPFINLDKKVSNSILRKYIFN